MSNPDRDRFDDLPILAELRGQLERGFAQSRRGAPGPGRARVQLRAWLRVLPGAVAAVAAVAVAAIALVALGHRHPGAGHRGPATRHSVRLVAPSPRRPAPPSPAELRRQRAEQRYITAAVAQVTADDPACRQPEGKGPTFIHGKSPGRQLLSLLAVMRRPAPPPDASTRRLMHGGFDAGAGVYVDYIRRTRSEYGKIFYLVPEARVGAISPIPARCDGEIMSALRHRLRHAIPAIRTAALRDEAGALSMARDETRHPEGLCFAIVNLRHRPGPNGVDMGCGFGFSDLEHGGGINIVEGDRAHGRIMAGAVSDQVASLTLEYPAGGGDPARTITVRAVNNVVVVKVPPRTYRIDSPAHTILRTASGRVIPQLGAGQ